MKLFLDTANLDEISDVINKGIIQGVTTNPSILAKEPKTDFLGHIKKIASLCRDGGNLPLSVEVFAKDPQSMFEQAMDIVIDVNYNNLNKIFDFAMRNFLGWGSLVHIQFLKI